MAVGGRRGDADSRLRQARMAIRRSFRRGIVVTRSVFDWADDVVIVPAPVLLAALSESPRRGLP